MPRNPRSDDHEQADRERRATQRLSRLTPLDDRPWRPEPVPPSAVDLAHLALWHSPEDPDVLRDALTLLPAARAEVDALSSGVLFAARAAGLTWAQIADALGLNSPQAAQQYLARLSARQES